MRRLRVDSLRIPRPVTVEELCAAHDPAFVEGVLCGEIENGFGNKSPAVAASLRHTSGAMLAAAERALENGIGAVAPCSGFHHAGYRYASRFCTFNGLMVTVVSLLARGLARRVGILDLDQHWGDGTHDIIEQLDLQPQVVHWSPARSHFRKEHARRFLVDLPRTLDRFESCDLVLYQAGADPHVDDPPGGNAGLRAGPRLNVRGRRRRGWLLARTQPEGGIAHRCRW